MADTLRFNEPVIEDQEDAAFLKAIDVVLSTGKRDYPDYIGGLKVASGMVVDVHSPIDDTIIFGSFQEPDDGLTERAVEVAKEAYYQWHRTSMDDRKEMLKKVLASVKQQRFRLAAMVSLSVGMTKSNSLEEVDTLISVMENALQYDKKVKSEGVWAIITSYNSPLAAPVGYAVAAVMAGNTVVMVPSVHSIMPVCTLYDMFVDAGIQDGVINIVFDRTATSSEEIGNNTELAGVVAAGLGEKMEDMMFLQVDDELRFINEIKGMNPILVYKPSSMRNAAKAVLESAFGNGMSVKACSKVVVLQGDEEAFVNAILAEANEMKITDPSDMSATMGPLVSKYRLDAFNEMRDEVSSNIIFGGKRITDDMTSNGPYVMPMIVMGLDDEHDLNVMDSALPILFIQVAKDLDDAIDIINCTEYGLSAGMITKDDKAADKFRKEVNAEFIFVNDRKGVPGAAHKATVDNFTA